MSEGESIFSPYWLGIYEEYLVIFLFAKECKETQVKTVFYLHLDIYEIGKMFILAKYTSGYLIEVLSMVPFSSFFRHSICASSSVGIDF
jgi:hypothetical protein